MNIVLTALAFAIATPASAQAVDPHAGHKAGALTPAAAAHADHDAATKSCCEGKQEDCCKDMDGKGCCADKAKRGAGSHAGHHGR